MSEVYTYKQGEQEQPRGMMAMLIEGLRASSYARSKPTSLGFSSLARTPRFNFGDGWDVIMEPGIAISSKPERHEHGIDAIAHLGKLSVELDPNDPDPLGTCKLLKKASDGEITKREIAEFSLPDLKAMYAPDLEWFDVYRKRLIEAFGLPSKLMEPAKKAGMGRYYSESIGTLWPGYYSFEET